MSRWDSFGTYDSTTCMYPVPAKEPDMDRLRFLRWLADRGLTEHRSIAPSSGDLTLDQAPEKEESRA